MGVFVLAFASGDKSDVSSVVFSGGHTERTFPKSVLLVTDDNIYVGGSVAGIALPMGLIGKDRILFLPSGSNVSVSYPSPFKLTLINLIPFDRIANDHIDHSLIPMSPKEVTGPTTELSVSLARLVLGSVEMRSWPLLIESVRTSLAVSVIRKLSPASTIAFDTTPYGLTREKKRKVNEYIRSSIDLKITIQSIADVAGMSIWHFARSFKLAMGMTPIQYVTKIRVNEANRKIRGTSLPLSQIAIDSGFNSQSHMNRSFKAYFGVSPGSLR